jgi:hypothetical protein
VLYRKGLRIVWDYIASRWRGNHGVNFSDRPALRPWLLLTPFLWRRLRR